MKTVLRGLLVVACVLAVGGLALAQMQRVPTRPRGGRTFDRRAQSESLVLANYDLEGKAPAEAMEPQRLRALLLYLTPEISPDVLALHSVRPELSGGEAKSRLAKLAASMRMYYAFEPTSQATGTALLSRFPIKSHSALKTPAGATVGMKAQVVVRQRTYALWLVRPPLAAADQAAIETVAADVNRNAQTVPIVFASFGTEVGASQALATWTRIGLVDPAGGAVAAATTYPAPNPTQRLDLILVSPVLRGQVIGYHVAREPRLLAVSDHLPVALVLRR